jgi:hypothetical protein
MQEEGCLMKRAIAILTVASATLLFVNTVSADLNDGLAAYYKFDGDATDSSGHGHHGTVYGATLTAGISGGAYSFDGVDDYISADATGLPTGARTVALWFYANTVANHPGLLGYGGQICGTSWIMDVNNRGTYPPCFQMQGHCESNEIDWPYDTPPVGAWYHFAVTTDSAGTTMYVNGEMKVANDTFVHNTYVDGTDLAIGVIVDPHGVAPYCDVNTCYSSGVIDEVRIYDRALSGDEVQQLALAGACCNPTDGSCNLTLPGACQYQWLGAGTVCDPNPCLSGACCLINYCLISTQSDCAGYGGLYQGNGSLCVPNPCTPPTATERTTWGRIKSQYR